MPFSGEMGLEKFLSQRVLENSAGKGNEALGCCYNADSDKTMGGAGSLPEDLGAEAGTIPLNSLIS